jgi:rhodanese-related sulfurtransferase
MGQSVINPPDRFQISGGIQMQSINRKYSNFLAALILAAAMCCAGFVTVPSVSAATSSFVEDEVPRVTIDQLKSMLAKKQSVVIIDARSSGYDQKIKGALSIPLDQMEAASKKLSRTRQIVIYCACGNEETAIAAAKVLREHGFKRVSALKGGWHSWVDSGGAVEAVK